MVFINNIFAAVHPMIKFVQGGVCPYKLFYGEFVVKVDNDNAFYGYTSNAVINTFHY